MRAHFGLPSVRNGEHICSEREATVCCSFTGPRTRRLLARHLWIQDARHSPCSHLCAPASIEIRADVCPSFVAEELDKRAPISVKFEIPYFTVSGIQVRYLKIVEKSGYQALPWVRYITQVRGHLGTPSLSARHSRCMRLHVLISLACRMAMTTSCERSVYPMPRECFYVN